VKPREREGEDCVKARCAGGAVGVIAARGYIRVAHARGGPARPRRAPAERSDKLDNPRRGREPEGRVIPLPVRQDLDAHVEVRRFGAALLDLVILAIVTIWLGDVFGTTRVTSGSALPTAVGFTYFTSATSVDTPWLIPIVVAVYGVQEALFGATWGKLVAGLRVVDAAGLRPTPGMALVRNVLRVVEYYPAFYLVGAVVAMLSPRRQRIGDRLAGTLVVRAESAPLAYLPAREVRRRLLLLLAGVAVFAAACGAFAYYGRPPLVIEGLKNTNSLFDRGDIMSYSLGAPRWGRGIVAYPITYRDAAHYHSAAPCRGTVALRWKGFFALGGGWVLDPRAYSCACSP
jgi:uncharacterized RDD family membrane protein YckC